MEASPKQSSSIELPTAETRVGIRELRHDFRAWLDRVRGGERVIVTDRGTPIADLVPYDPARTWLRRMYDEGEVVVGSGNLRVGWSEDDEISTAGTEALEHVREERLT